MKVDKFPPQRRSRRLGRLEGALEEGLGLVRTKGGAGDKDVAYIVKQNHFLRLFLGGCVFLLFLLVSFISYIHWFDYIKWNAVSGEIFHYASENTAQTKLLNTQLELKNSLETLLHQTHRIAEFRSYLERSLGDNGNSLKEALNEQSHLSQDFTEQIIKDHDIIGTKVVKALDDLLEQFEDVNRKAMSSYKLVSDEIITNIDDDMKDHERYHKTLKKYGADKASIKKLKNSKYEKISAERKKSMTKVEQKLDNYFRKINDLPSLTISETKIAEWEEFLTNVVKTIKDSSKEADIATIIRRTNDMMLKDTGGSVKLFDPKKDRSIVDYLKDKIEAAKLSDHKAELMQLYADWRDKRKHTNNVLKEVENISQRHRALWLG